MKNTTINVNVYVYLVSKTGLIFCNVFATLNRTLATLSFAKNNTVGSIDLAVISAPQASART